MAIAYIKVFFDFDERTEALSDPEKERLLLAMVRYASGGEEPTTLKGAERILWPVFRKEIDLQMAAYNTRIENGNKGGRPSKKTENNRTKPNETENNRTETENNRNPQEQEQEQEQDKEQEQEHEKTRAREDPQFDQFWKAYPRKEDKQAARKAWNRIRPGPEKVAAMMAALEKQKRSDQWTRDGGQFIPYACKWLNHERWKDESTAPAQIRPAVAAQDYDQRDYTGAQDEVNRRMVAMMEQADLEGWRAQ